MHTFQVGGRDADFVWVFVHLGYSEKQRGEFQAELEPVDIVEIYERRRSDVARCLQSVGLLVHHGEHLSVSILLHRPFPVVGHNEFDLSDITTPILWGLTAIDRCLGDRFECRAGEGHQRVDVLNGELKFR